MAKSPDFLALDVLDSLREGCQVIGFDYRYLYLNAAAARHGQRPPEALLGRTMAECYPGIDGTAMFAALRRCLETRAADVMDNEFTFPDGSKAWFELRFVPVPQGACVLSMDVTGRKRAEASLRSAEEQFRHAQKMEAVGRLAGGVAHDFNNLLSVILTYAQMLLGGLSPKDPLHGDLTEIKKAGERAAALTRQLLTFSRQQVLERRVLDLNDVVAQVDKMLRRVLGEDVELAILPASGLGSIRADPGQLEQVLMNLVVNSRDAMPDGGKLTIETANVDLDDHYAREHVGVAPGPYVMIAVSDTGQGMDRATLARIFEPFFTTKEQGTGLGLATVFGIVKQSGGHLWVYSEPGKGTTFKIYFPRTAEAVGAAGSGRDVADLGGSETILLVEDDAQVRTAVLAILRHLGYRVIEAAGPGEALLACERHEGTIDLLLSDVVMPQMSGADLAKRLCPGRPTMKVLFMSGYTDEAVLRHGILEAGLSFLQKPVTPDALGRKLRELLGARA